MYLRALTLAFGASLVLALMPVRAQDGKAEIAPVPEWVEDSGRPDPDLVSRDEAEDGSIVLLYDMQRRKTADGYDSFWRFAELVTSVAGLEEAARLSLDYDPTKEEIILHDVAIWRGGKKLDRLEGLELQFARQEQELDRGIVDGRMTVFAELPDVRVGDIIDVSHTLVAKTPLWPDEFFADFPTRFVVDTGFGRRRIIVPDDLPLTIRTRGDAEDMTVSRKNGMTEYLWQATHPDIYDYEANTPVGHIQGGSLSISSYDEWSDVAAWAADLYDIDMTLPAGLAEELDELKGTDAEKITWAIRHVQDNVRYVSDVIGLGAYRPRPPALTGRRGYGDCKDKSLLLTAMLRHMGYEAVPALVHSDEGALLPLVAPGPVHFDHVIVRIEWQGKPHYIDATWSLQGGVFPEIYAPRYSWALPIRPGAELEEMNDSPLDAPEKEVVETYAFEDSGDIAFTVASVFHGRAADVMRGDISETSNRTMSENYRDWYRKRYPGLDMVERIKVTDDRDANLITMMESYSLAFEDFEADDLDDEFAYSAYSVDYDLPEVDGKDRKAPIAIPHPLNAVHEVIVENGGTHDGMEAVSSRIGPLSVDFETKEDGERLHLRWAIRTEGRAIPAEDAQSYERARRAFDDLLYITWDFGKLGEDDETEQSPSVGEILRDAFFGR
ncbi:DUF3857 domain-containing transglutaminase family protein [Parvularcula marina]|uniref:DUF3857 domain-containing protein n=1 Tax=Parvularcula marina TaxID=2292771 RepID=A0A371RJR6_9PROT|nr:DUF3857 domain-containing protein [Parvularcula marina]RFB05690.1 DUF3857 domain-containing protein [Parvularcula marina]